MKRIAIVVLSRHISSLGGVGFYVDSFVQATKGEYICDLIVDRPLKPADIPFPNASQCSIVCALESVSTLSSKYFMFTDISPVEFTSNILHSIFKAHKSRAYDAVFVQSFELVPGILHSGIQRLVPTFAFTHDGYFYENFPKESIEYYGALNALVPMLPHMTQIPGYKWHCLNDQVTVPMFTSDEEFIAKTKWNPQPGTVLYNGTLRDIKRPDHFVEFCKTHKKKALVITNDKGQVYFEKALGAAGIDYVIRTHIFGQEKIDFIAQAEMMFHPSESEMFSYAIIEAMCFMPVVVYDEKWSRRYPEGILNFITDIKKFSDKDLINASKWARDYIDSKKIKAIFAKYLEDRKVTLGLTRSTTRDAVAERIASSGGCSIEDYWNNLRSIDKPGVEDIKITYKLIEEFGMVHDKHSTSIGSKISVESAGLDAFF